MNASQEPIPVGTTTRVLIGLIVAGGLVAALFMAAPAHRLNVDRGALIRDVDSAQRVAWLRAVDTDVAFRLWSRRGGDWTVLLENVHANGSLMGATVRDAAGPVLRLTTPLQARRAQTINYRVQPSHDNIAIVALAHSAQALSLLPDMVNEANLVEPYCLVHCGGMTLSGARAEYETFLRATAHLEVPAYHTAGPHDAQGRGAFHFRRLLGPAGSSVGLGAARLILLDSSTVPLSSDTRAGLTLALDAAVEHAVIVFTHRAPLVDDDLDARQRLPRDDVRWLARELARHAGQVRMLVCAADVPPRAMLGEIPVKGVGTHGDQALLIEMQDGEIMTDVLTLPLEHHEDMLE